MTEMNHFYDQLQTIEDDREFSPKERLSAVVRPLLHWYHKNARDLPWRQNPTPYQVWISEIMLQQTRVEAVKPYYARFMEALPTAAHLAKVEDQELMKLWEGLGYYSRARNLKKAAVSIVEQYGGELPADVDKLLSLPGIGSYTAGAVASIAFRIPAPAVDGNVLRVLSRLLASREDIRKPSVKTWMENLLKQVIPAGDPGSFNQALIEIGAIVCLPAGEPKCGECPLYTMCLARRQGLLKEIPFRSPLKKRKIEKLTVCLIFKEGRVAIRKRPDQGLLASLYELPNVPGWLKEEQVLEALDLSGEQVEQMEALPEAKHIFSHIEWHMKGFLIRLKPEEPSKKRSASESKWEGDFGEGFLFADVTQIRGTYALPGAFAAYTRLIGT